MWRLARFTDQRHWQFFQRCLWVVDGSPEYVQALSLVPRRKRSRLTYAYRTYLRVPGPYRSGGLSYFYVERAAVELLNIWRPSRSFRQLSGAGANTPSKNGNRL